MTMTFQEALALTSPRVGAWDYRSDDDRTISLYEVGTNGATLLATQEVSVDAREGVNELLRGAGIRIGGTHRDQRFVWAMDEAGATIWSATARVVEIAPVADTRITQVVTFFRPEDRGHRGVRGERADGTRAAVVEEHDTAPSIDPTYGPDQLELDLEWAYYLGQDLANWLDVPHFDQLTDAITNANQRLIGGGLRELAALVEQAPAHGVFPPIHHTFGAVAEVSELVLRVAPLTAERRLIELRATSRRALAGSVATLKQGTNAELAAFLRQLRTPSVVLRKMNAVLGI